MTLSTIEVSGNYDAVQQRNQVFGEESLVHPTGVATVVAVEFERGLPVSLTELVVFGAIVGGK